jgi:hypothetical protein
MMTFWYAKGGAGARYARANAEGVIPRFTVAWGGARNLGSIPGRNGYKECKIGYPAWDELADRVLAIKTTGHTPVPANSRALSSVIEIVVNFHLAYYLAIAVKLNSQVARLRDLDDSDDDGEEPAESEGSTDSDDEPQFFVRPLFASGGGVHKERVRDYCTRMIAKTTAEMFCCATCQRKFCNCQLTPPLTAVLLALVVSFLPS